MKLLSTLSLLGLLSLSLPVWAETVPSDVPSDHWAAQALSDLSSKYGFQLGYPDGTFRGERPVTRYEMAALLVKLLQQQAGKNVSPEDQALIARLRAALAPELETWKNEQQEALDLLRDETDRLADAQMSLKDDFAQALLNGGLKITLPFSPDFPLQLAGDYLYNLAATTARQGYQGSIQLGHTRRPGNFFVAYVFKHLEANGSLSLFVEDQLGGTDIMAHEGQVGVKVWDNTTLFSTVQWRQRLSAEDPGIWTVRAGIHQAF
jgi:hypothetical protein